MFKDINGNLSSKRILGALAMAFSFVLTVWIIYSKNEVGVHVIAYPYGMATLLLGSTVAEKKHNQ